MVEYDTVLELKPNGGGQYVVSEFLLNDPSYGGDHTRNPNFADAFDKSVTEMGLFVNPCCDR